MTHVMKKWQRAFISVVIVWVLFTLTLLPLGHDHFKGIDGPLPPFEHTFTRAYFALSTISMLGLGDVTPSSIVARSLTMCVMFVTMLGFVTNVLD